MTFWSKICYVIPQILCATEFHVNRQINQEKRPIAPTVLHLKAIGFHLLIRGSHSNSLPWSIVINYWLIVVYIMDKIQKAIDTCLKYRPIYLCICL